MKTRLSGLVDGELDELEAKVLLDAVKGDPQLRACWHEYQLIGDTLRGERSLPGDITAQVMAALADEPVVLAPRPVRQPAWQRTALALAATLAGVAVVGWLALAQRNDVSPAGEQLAQGATPQSARADARDMQQYLVAHQAQSSLLQFRGGTENIRTVAAGGAAGTR